jgi:hypothetical protein
VIVSDEQDVPDDHGMIPRLALERRDARDLRELIRRCFHQNEVALFGGDEKQVLIREQDDLAVPVSSALPLARAVR